MDLAEGAEVVRMEKRHCDGENCIAARRNCLNSIRKEPRDTQEAIVSLNGDNPLGTHYSQRDHCKVETRCEVSFNWATQSRGAAR